MSIERLTGTAYLDFWRTRMAKGPQEAAKDGKAEQSETQAAIFFAELKRALSVTEIACTRILEVGSGYGRMLEKFRGVFPEAWLYGLDLSDVAILGSWKDDYTILATGSALPPYWRWPLFDLIYTCTCLQHVTDDAVLATLTEQMQSALWSDGTLLLLEQVYAKNKPHVREMTLFDYRELFPRIQWDEGSFWFTYEGEPHIAMRGMKKG